MKFVISFLIGFAAGVPIVFLFHRLFYGKCRKGYAKRWGFSDGVFSVLLSDRAPRGMYLLRTSCGFTHHEFGPGERIEAPAEPGSDGGVSATLKFRGRVVDSLWVKPNG